MPRYDAVVIGSGQAGNPLSQKLADQGWTVALIEKENLGGTCVNTRCTPTKTMIASAQVAHYARHAANWGVQAGAVRVDLPSVVARKDRIVNQWRSGVDRKIAARKNLHLHRGAARFLAPHRIRNACQPTFGCLQKLLALPGALLGQIRIAAGNQPLAGKVGRFDLCQIAVVEQGELRQPLRRELLGERGWCAYVVDQRGHGESEWPDERYTFDAFAGDVRALARAVGTHRDRRLAGAALMREADD